MREGTVIAGKYRLERPLARGGMGAVWVAQHLQLDEQVAVKFMDISLPTVADARVRFEREAKSAARIRSPHVVQILDHGVDGEMPYIVMELLEGEHLGTRLKRDGRISIAAAGIIAEQVAKALHRAHRAGIIHRDLKPANVFLARIDDDEIVKILDFGIVKSMTGGGVLTGEATKSDVLMGSPNYMSPEQARGARTVDHRTDLWSLGVVLFRAVTGRMAFNGDSVVDVILKICTGPIPLASEAAPDLPPVVDAFFQRALERDPARRFSSAREMGSEFGALVKLLGAKAEEVGPRPRSSVEPPEQARSSIVEVASGDIVVASAPESTDGAVRWRQLLQGAAETPTVAHSRNRAHASPTLAPPSDSSAALAALLKPPAEAPAATPLAALLRPPSGSPTAASSAVLKTPPPFVAKASAAAIAAVTKTHPFARPNPLAPLAKTATAEGSSQEGLPLREPSRDGLSVGGSLLDTPDEATGEAPEEGESSTFVHMATPSSSGGAIPQSDRSAEIARFVDQAFIALQVSEPTTEDVEASREELFALGSQPSWLSSGPPTTPITSRSRTGSRDVADDPDAGDADPAQAKGPDSTAPPASTDNLLGPIRPKVRSVHAERISKLVDEGFAALKRGDRERARACWSEALSIDPSDRALRLNLRKLETKGRG